MSDEDKGISRRKFVAASLLAGATVPTAYDLSALTGHSGASFGVDTKKAAAALRELAANIEAGTFLLQEGGVFTLASREDFAMTTLYLQFHEKLKKG